MQLLGEAAVVKGSKVTHQWTAQQLAGAGGSGSSRGSDAAPVMPRILRIDPVAIAGAASQVLLHLPLPMLQTLMLFGTRRGQPQASS